MKTSLKNPFLLPVLIAALGLIILAGRVTAQTFTTLHSFTALDPITNTNSDGANPFSGLALSGTSLYGTTYQGGSSEDGTVFAINTDGTGFTNLHNFSSSSDGANPYAGLILSDSTLYATAIDGGNANAGTVFSLKVNGTGFTNLHRFTSFLTDFTNSDGAHPYAGVILSGTTLYGTAVLGGSSGVGTVFKVNSDGTAFTTLHSFTAGSGFYSNYTNNDGAYPYAGLILSGKTLFGTTKTGGSSGNGTVFAVNSDGTGFTNLYFFLASSANSSGVYTNGDGAYPQAGLIVSGNTLYGTTSGGGSSGNGSVFAVNTNGTGFTNLHSFMATSTNSSGSYTNSEGAYPYSKLVLSGNTLYGTTLGGGTSGNGTAFKVNTDGSGFTNLYSFTGGNDGAYPYSDLVFSGNTVYGTASQGGSSGNGTVFSLSLGSVSRPQLSIVRSTANVILTWPTNASGFTLQSTTNLASAVWTTNSPPPVIVNGQNTVTNPISGTRMFYRLSQ
jgi:uncharacterized repeat protein (TIGR03803 family)